MDGRTFEFFNGHVIASHDVLMLYHRLELAPSQAFTTKGSPRNVSRVFDDRRDCE